jgi:hypothetical protein
LPNFDAGRPPPRRQRTLTQCRSSRCWAPPLQNTSGPRTPSSPGSRTTFVTSLLRLGVRNFVTLIQNHESSLVRATFGKARYLDKIPVNSRDFGCLIMCWVCGTEQPPVFVNHHPHATAVRVPACYGVQHRVFTPHGELGSHEWRADATARCRLN